MGHSAHIRAQRLSRNDAESRAQIRADTASIMGAKTSTSDGPQSWVPMRRVLRNEPPEKLEEYSVPLRVSTRISRQQSRGSWAPSVGSCRLQNRGLDTSSSTKSVPPPP